MADIFLSYASEDRSVAKKLARALEKNGFSVWWDRDIPPGRPFGDVIKERLDDAKCVIVLWSDHSASSHWVKDEASAGLNRNVLVPALIDDVAIPLGFGQTHAANLIAWNGASDDEGFGSLLDSVRSLTRPDGAEPAPARSPHRVSPWRRGLNLLALALLVLLSLATVSATCANPDAVLLTAIAGTLASAFLIFRVRGPARFVWVLVPIVTLAVGMPYGHGYGRMTRSSLFGLQTGEYCQEMSGAYYLAGGLFLAALIVDLFFYFWGRRYRRRVPLTAAAIFVTGGVFLLVTNLGRYSDQYDHASDLARKYGYFSLGEERWNRPTAGGFSNDFEAAGDVVRDAATGLTWHRSGSPESVAFPQLPGYVSSLNAARVGGFDDWRIPSLAEAWTLLERRQENGLHLDPVFGSEQTWIWTSTIADDGYGWFVFFNWGRPIFQNAWGSHAYVRAVRGDPWE